ncbi:MAG: GntP family permease [Cellulomonadaceae bacterium]|jgi:GntP family gluconate:H+ symporter|nr:GntP family permease [Cellulomonadaceae bacterium]
MSLFLPVLIVSIALLVLLVVKFKVHPVLALFVTGLAAGLAFRFGFLETIDLFTTGFGNTMRSIGLIIIFGSIIAVSIQDTGAIKTLTNFFIKLFRGKNLELSTGLAAFIISIPIFGDVTKVLAAPIVSVIAKRKKKSMSTMSTWTHFASSLTHSMVPPTPGILAVTLLVGADLGLMIGWSIALSIVTYLAVWLILRKWVDREWIEPKADYIKGIESYEGGDWQGLIIKEKGLPNVFTAVLPILLPIVLIAGASITNLNVAEGNAFRTFMDIVGQRDMALFLAAVCAIILGGTLLKNNVLKYSEINTGEKPKGILDTVVNGWVGRALMIALMPLLVTPMGGGFSNVIRAYPGIDHLGEIIADSGFPAILIPWLISAVLMAAVGSRTVAGMTAGGLVIPMMGALGLSPLAVALLIGSGSMVGTHVSDSGFWVSTQLYNLNTKQGFKYVTFVQAVAGVVSLILIALMIPTGVLG